MALRAGLGHVPVDMIRNHNGLIHFGLFALCAASTHWIGQIILPPKLPTQGEVVREIFRGKMGLLENFDPRTRLGSFRPFFPILGRTLWKCILPQDQVNKLNPGDVVWSIDIAGDAVVVEDVGHSLEDIEEN